MPYKTREEQLAYNREWAKRKRDSGSFSPLAERVFTVISRYERPVSPAEILPLLDPPTSYKSLAVALDRMKHGGRIVHLGYGRWAVAE